MLFALSSRLAFSTMSSKDTPCLDPELRALKRAKFLEILKNTPEYLGLCKKETAHEQGDVPSTPTSWQYCSKRCWEGKFRRFKLAIKAKWAEQQQQTQIP